MLQRNHELGKQEAIAGQPVQLRSDWNVAKYKFQELVIQEEIKWCEKSQINRFVKETIRPKYFIP